MTLKASQNLVTDLLDTYPPFQHTKSGAPMIKFPIGTGKTARTTFIDYIPPTSTEPEKTKKRKWGSSFSKTTTLNDSFSKTSLNENTQ